MFAFRIELELFVSLKQNSVMTEADSSYKSNICRSLKTKQRVTRYIGIVFKSHSTRITYFDKPFNYSRVAHLLDCKSYTKTS